MFTVFASQEERCSACGSDCFELQFCKMPRATALGALVHWENITHWQSDSLYVLDEERFIAEYGKFFAGGVYANLQTGPVDGCGINYYSPEKREAMLERLRAEEPEDSACLIDWLERAAAYNGFYLLGV